MSIVLEHEMSRREDLAMSFFSRAAIALLTGIGAGLLGFWAVWSVIVRVLAANPGIGFDAWLLGGIFVPGTVIPLLVFRSISRTIPSN
jgi:hypothetical protein